jgi:GNAT superfamily N-acetyltransferase
LVRQPGYLKRYPIEIDINIRDATIDDALAISEHVSALATQYIAPSLGDGGLERLLASMDVASTRQRILDGWPHLCAFDGNDLVGVLVVKPPTHLYHLFVSSDFQRTGVGKNLFSIGDERLFGETHQRLATVNSSLNAVCIYERLGFVANGPLADVGGVRFQPMVRQRIG